jgi:hypothetical protein
LVCFCKMKAGRKPASILEALVQDYLETSVLSEAHCGVVFQVRRRRLCTCAALPARLSESEPSDKRSGGRLLRIEMGTPAAPGCLAQRPIGSKSSGGRAVRPGEHYEALHGRCSAAGAWREPHGAEAHLAHETSNCRRISSCCCCIHQSLASPSLCTSSRLDGPLVWGSAH